jgi:hypothetical protein
VKKTVLFVLASILLLGCDSGERERKLREREQQLEVKEQSLLLKEKQLQLKEEELQLTRQAILDSSSANDSMLICNSGYLGVWSAKMTCTETNCTTSAVGDTKVELWDVKYVNGSVLVSAYANNNLIRVYSGAYKNDILELDFDSDEGPHATIPITIRVRLWKVKDRVLKGTREIIRNDCNIMYDMQLNKQ